MTHSTAAKVLREMALPEYGHMLESDKAAALGALALEAFAWMAERKLMVEWREERHCWEVYTSILSSEILGTGPDPLAAIQDAIGKEKS